MFEPVGPRAVRADGAVRHERTARVLAGYRRTAPGRGVESGQVDGERGRLDAVIAGLLFMAGMRRSEVSALRWADAADGDGVLVTVRRDKTNQEGETRDVRFVKDGVARALRTLRAAAGPSARAICDSTARPTTSSYTDPVGRGDLVEGRIPRSVGRTAR